MAVIFDFRVGLGAGLMALAIGHRASLDSPIKQSPWRFLQSPNVPFTLLHLVCLSAAGIAVFRLGSWCVLAPAFLWVVSLFYFGRRWELGDH